jgi:hypothetical protein
MPASVVQNVIKYAGVVKGKVKFASAFCCLQRATRIRSVTMMEIECLSTVWIEKRHQKCIPRSRAAIQTKALDLFKRVKGNMMK